MNLLVNIINWHLRRNNLLVYGMALFLPVVVLGQTPNYSGDWKITSGTGSKVTIEHSSNSISIKYLNDTYDCTLEGSTVKGTSIIQNQWLGEDKECYDKVMANPGLAGNFKNEISLTYANNRFTGTIKRPAFSCTDDEAQILEGTTETLKLERPPNDIYWITRNKIFKSKVNDIDTKEEVITDLEKGSFIALDDGAQTIFWVDGSAIYAANADGSNKIELSKAEEPVFSPMGLVVDGTEKVIFWAEDRAIYRYDYLSGNTNRHKIITQPVKPIVSLALDRKNKRIYWLSNYTDIIHQANYDGTGVEPFVEDKATSIAIDEEGGLMYCAHYESIRKIELNSRSSEVIIKRDEMNDPYRLTWDKDFKRIYFTDGNAIKKASDRNYTVVESDLGYMRDVFDFELATGSASGETLDTDMAFNIWSLIRAGE
jgi:hypothetical protein